MRFIKQVLHSLLGEKGYLRVVSKGFFFAFYSEMLKKNPLYQCHYFAENLVKPGDIVIDLGANLGYYTVIFSSLVGKKGEVHAVEPVRLFREVLFVNTKKQRRKFRNIKIVPYALGDQNGQVLTMGMTVEKGVFRHGLTRVLDAKEISDFKRTERVKVYKPITLFNKLPHIDFIKCDVEGYETKIIPYFLELIRLHRPLMQIEIGPLAHREELFNFAHTLNYQVYYLDKERLHLVVDHSMQYALDFYFVPIEKQEKIVKYL